MSRRQFHKAKCRCQEGTVADVLYKSFSHGPCLPRQLLSSHCLALKMMCSEDTTYSRAVCVCLPLVVVPTEDSNLLLLLANGVLF